MKGSERNRPPGEELSDIKTTHSLVHMNNFMKALPIVVEHLKNEARGIANPKEFIMKDYQS